MILVETWWIRQVRFWVFHLVTSDSFWKKFGTVANVTQRMLWKMANAMLYRHSFSSRLYSWFRQFRQRDIWSYFSNFGCNWRSITNINIGLNSWNSWLLNKIRWCHNFDISGINSSRNSRNRSKLVLEEMNILDQSRTSWKCCVGGTTYPCSQHLPWQLRRLQLRMAALLHWLGITIDPVVDFGEEFAFHGFQWVLCRSSSRRPASKEFKPWRFITSSLRLTKNLAILKCTHSTRAPHKANGLGSQHSTKSHFAI